MTKIQTGIFTATIFVSAFLLFLVQPMFAKMMLPVLGGTAAVWGSGAALVRFSGAGGGEGVGDGGIAEAGV